LRRLPKGKFDEMNDLVERYAKDVFESSSDAECLADMYVEKHIIPPKSRQGGGVYFLVHKHLEIIMDLKKIQKKTTDYTDFLLKKCSFVRVVSVGRNRRLLLWLKTLKFRQFLGIEK
jgi:hypothetical protein